jgi:hypothetical protein
MSPRQPETMWVRKGAASLILWGICSAALTIYNRWLLHHKSFHFPVSLTCLHSACNFLLAKMYLSTDSRASVKMPFSTYAAYFVPVGVLQSCSIALRNSAAMYATVSSLQLVSGIAPLLVYAFSIALGLESFSKDRTVSVLLIFFGVSAASFMEYFSHPMGISLQLLGLTCETMKSAWLKKGMVATGTSLDLVGTLSVISPVIFAFTFPVVVMNESNSMLQFVMKEPSILLALSGNILLAVMLNVAYLQAVKANPLTFCAIATVFKDCFLVYLSPLIFGSSIKLWTGFYAVAVVGILQFTGIF